MTKYDCNTTGTCFITTRQSRCSRVQKSCMWDYRFKQLYCAKQSFYTSHKSTLHICFACTLLVCNGHYFNCTKLYPKEIFFRLHDSRIDLLGQLCGVPIDVVFVLDSSRYTGSDGWNSLKDFVSDMINRNFNIAPNRIRVSKAWFI